MLLDEYSYARVSAIFQVVLYHFILAKLATSSIRVNTAMRDSFIQRAKSIGNIHDRVTQENVTISHITPTNMAIKYLIHIKLFYGII